MLLVVTGPIASGKSTLARGIACEFEARGTKAAVVDLDLIYEMLDPARGPKSDAATWAQARRMSARLAQALLAEGLGVVVEGGDFLTTAEREEFTGALPPGVVPRFITLSVSYELALERATKDETRGVSRDPGFLRQHYDAIAQALRDVPATDLRLDTGTIGVADAAGFVADWAFALGGAG